MRSRPDAVIYSTITAALLAPRPGAIRLDALAASNRPGRHGVWQRPRERALLARATLLVPVSESALAGAPAGHAPAVVVPIAVEPSGPAGERDIAAITYAADAHKKGLDRVLAAWALARRDGEELLVAGSAPVARAEGVRALGPLPREQYRALLRRARVYVSAPRREEYGIAQLEALADGAMVVALGGRAHIRRAPARPRRGPAAGRERPRAPDPHRARRSAGALRPGARRVQPAERRPPRRGAAAAGAAAARLSVARSAGHGSVLAICCGPSHARRAVHTP